MSALQSPTALIIGGGPGGLAAAIGLRQAGIRPHVYEGTSGQAAAGSGLTLWPNAMQALEALGAAGAVRSVSQPLEGMAMYHQRGGVLFRILPEIMTSHFGDAGRALKRADLVTALLSELGEAAVHYSARCTGFEQDTDGVTAFFEDGTTARGDLLVGADGLWSTLRTALFGPLPLRYAGFTVWRGIAAYTLAPRIGVTSLGRGHQFGFFALPHEQVYWFASANAEEGAQEALRKADLLAQFTGWHDPVADLIAATDEAIILRNDIYDLDPLDTWGRGRVTLLGDAAHPFAPTLGQGACQALEDAAVLSWCLREVPVEEALRTYEARRIQRASAITLESRRMGQVGQWEHPVGCWLRNRLIQSIPQPLHLKQLRATFQFEPGR